MILVRAVDVLAYSAVGDSCWWPRYTGPRCAASDCGAPLAPGADGFLAGCEHAGVSRNLTMDEQFALRRAPKVDAVAQVHPAPVVAMRDAEPGEIPNAVRLVLRKVVDPWQVRTTYSRGTAASGAKVVDSVVVRFTHPDGRRGWAGWVDGKFDVAFIAEAGWVRAVNATALKVLLANPESEAM